MDGTADSARAAALRLFDDRWRIVRKEAELNGFRRRLDRYEARGRRRQDTSDKDDLVGWSLLHWWLDCLRAAADPSRAIAVKYAVRMGWRSLIAAKHPKHDALGHVWIECDLLARRPAEPDGHVNGPLEQMGKPRTRLPMVKYADMFHRLPDQEQQRLRDLYDNGIHVREAARRLGVSRQALRRKLADKPGFGRDLGGFRFYDGRGKGGRGKYLWKFPFDFLVAPPRAVAALQNRGEGQRFIKPPGFFPANVSSLNDNGGRSNGLRTTANAATSGARNRRADTPADLSVQ